MKRAPRIFAGVVLLVLAAGFASYWINRPEPPPEFTASSRVIQPRTKPSLAVGRSFAAMVAPEGTLWAWGDPQQVAVDLGIPSGTVPRLLDKNDDWKQVAAGYYGLLALRQDGSLWAIGSNTEGLLGLQATNSSVNQLTRVGNDNDWKEISAGVAHCMALKQDSSLWVWGQNNYGQIGIGTVTPRELPTRVGTDTNWVAISPGAFSCYALKDDGTIWTWGLDFVTSRNNPSPVQVGQETNWMKIAAGDYHLAAIAADGTSWVIGANASLLNPAATNPAAWFKLNSDTNWIDLRSGQNFLLARRKNGGWHTAGQRNVYSGREGFWDFPIGFDPLALHTERQTTLMLMRDGRLWSLGKRVGSQTSLGFFEHLRAVVLRLSGQNANITLQEKNDARPFLIWEQP